jgi:hypothetical protein
VKAAHGSQGIGFECCHQLALLEGVASIPNVMDNRIDKQQAARQQLAKPQDTMRPELDLASLGGIPGDATAMTGAGLSGPGVGAQMMHSPSHLGPLRRARCPPPTSPGAISKARLARSAPKAELPHSSSAVTHEV